MYFVVIYKNFDFYILPILHIFQFPLQSAIPNKWLPVDYLKSLGTIAPYRLTRSAEDEAFSVTIKKMLENCRKETVKRKWYKLYVISSLEKNCIFSV